MTGRFWSPMTVEDKLTTVNQLSKYQCPCQHHALPPRSTYPLKFVHDGLIYAHLLKVSTDIVDHIVNDEPIH